MTMTANELIERLAALYADCDSYLDEGQVESGMGTTIFKTYFVRPDKFRFQWCNKSRGIKPDAIWSSGDKIFSYYGEDQSIEEMADLTLAVASATGVSSGVAHTVPSLLLPDSRIARDSTTLIKLSPYNFAEEKAIRLGTEDATRLFALKANGRIDLTLRNRDGAIIEHTVEATYTEEDDQAALEALRKLAPEAAEQMALFMQTQTEADRKLSSTARYDKVVFNASIDEAVFNCSAKDFETWN